MNRGFDYGRWNAGPKTVDRFIACGGLERAKRPMERPLFTERRNRFWRRAWPWLVAAGALAVWLVARSA